MDIHWKKAVVLAPVIALASIAPNAFPAAQKGIASLKDLAIELVIPAVIGLILITVLSRFAGKGDLARTILRGAIAGSLATISLELIRYPGFLLGFMPGNLPELMGVLLLDQFAMGPTTMSSLAGFAYHFVNGASFGILFVCFAEIGLVRESLPWTVGYGILLGVGFMVSPVVESLGVGFFGVDFGWSFAITVTLAHAAFGATLAPLLRMLRAQSHSKPNSWRNQQAATLH